MRGSGNRVMGMVFMCRDFGDTFAAVNSFRGPRNKFTVSEQVHGFGTSSQFGRARRGAGGGGALAFLRKIGLRAARDDLVDLELRLAHELRAIVEGEERALEPGHQHV